MVVEISRVFAVVAVLVLLGGIVALTRVGATPRRRVPRAARVTTACRRVVLLDAEPT